MGKEIFPNNYRAPGSKCPGDHLSGTVPACVTDYVQAYGPQTARVRGYGWIDECGGKVEGKKE